ncbi:MAG: NADH-quinone oxidoreductase subunit NuoK [Paludibacteraceae bacterium]|jgi:NADH-quinone oxidoreductase subunit K|nr:NADH-quinone oxidoreductase subunit NuoK [Paludibacteraceae bacterium]MBP5524823.1 NADH-quinone oxidoreductase subunit NuoK [Paludibacteraceae bacterium]MBQ8020163.1 NADH-quinone oxidoreductase subunit NuoK [Paludibacteraceae bacterium]MBR6111067.1 NADH-quinone oxidoreductase subunit NuoK [Paludibacteraceae bacterium]MEE0084254.1 NADH-quinone oxidoreductase subunit NuoK [Paludibacteraceae bacterium]
MIPVEAYLVVSTLLFFIGVYGFFVRKNLIGILMAVELILNAVNINFVVFNRFLYPDHLEGYMYSLFVIVVAAAETAIAISIIINVYRKLSNIRVDSINELKN